MTGTHAHSSGRDWDALAIRPEDDVAVALRDLAGRARVRRGDAVVEIALPAPVPSGHKIALRALAAGEPVRKYGEPIGRATRPIGIGEHVHVHNLASARAGGRPG